jgi:hypothetical protein
MSIALSRPPRADEQEECSVRNKVLSFALGAGLMAASVGPVFAQGGGSGPDMGTGEGGRPMTRAEMIKGIQDFCAETARNWSIEGYSDAPTARATEGNSQSDWLTNTQTVLGIRTDISTAALCTQVASLAAQASGATTTQGGAGSTTGSGGTGPGGQASGTTQGGQSPSQGGQGTTGGGAGSQPGSTGGQPGESGPGGSGGTGSGGPGR